MIDRFVLLGVSHQTAPVAVRERIARLSEHPDLSPDRLRQIPGIAEGMLLSTCNRVEAYGAGEPDRVAAGFRDLLGREPEVAPHLYERRGEAALKHLFRVASSLDSMVVGEPQILGQLKDAFRRAQRSGATGDTLHRAVGRAFAVAKRVRSETELGRSAVSMVHAAIELAKRVFETLEGKRALVLGAGRMARLTAEKLIAEGVAELRILNRTADAAGALAGRLAGPGRTVEGLGLDALGDGLVWADLVVAAAAAEAPLVTAALLKPRLRARRYRQLLFVDLAVPRVVDPALSKFENVYVRDVDDVGQLAAQNAARRLVEAERAELIVAAEVESFARVLRGRSAVPVLAALRQWSAQVAAEEAVRTLGHGPWTEEQRASVEAMAQAIVKKLLHAPTAKLRAAAEAGESVVLADAAEELFGLDPGSAPGKGGGDPGDSGIQ